MGAMTTFLLAADPAPADSQNTLDKVLMLPLPSCLDEFRQRFGVRVRTLYNQTEVSVPIASPGFDTPDFRTCGVVREGYECRIVDDQDRVLPAGAVGELVLRSDEPWTMMYEYLGDPEATVRAWRNLWLHTGDAFTRDEDGNYFFVDRIDDVIRRRGENISSAELEASVCEHPAVTECAAIAVASSWGESEVKIVVVPTPGSKIDPGDLLQFLSKRLPRFMVPRYLEVVGELPRTPTAKVRKSELRDVSLTAATWDAQAPIGSAPQAGMEG
jgi:crotonobetaine/carnitine-CoA ligase